MEKIIKKIGYKGLMVYFDSQDKQIYNLKEGDIVEVSTKTKVEYGGENSPRPIITNEGKENENK